MGLLGGGNSKTSNTSNTTVSDNRQFWDVYNEENLDLREETNFELDQSVKDSGNTTIEANQDYRLDQSVKDSGNTTIDWEETYSFEDNSDHSQAYSFEDNSDHSQDYDLSEGAVYGGGNVEIQRVDGDLIEKVSGLYAENYEDALSVAEKATAQALELTDKANARSQQAVTDALTGAFNNTQGGILETVQQAAKWAALAYGASRLISAFGR